jgi:hypothetical protein
VEYKREPVKGYEEYEVDTNGVVYGKNGKPLKYSINHNGYCIVNFYINHKRTGFGIHTLVAKQFIFNKDVNKIQVNHIDGDKTNNNVENLEWVTQQENMRHSIDVLGNNIGEKNWRAKAIKGINKKDKNELYFNAMSDGARYLSEINNVNFNYAKQSLWRALNGYLKSYKGYVWQYI